MVNSSYKVDPIGQLFASLHKRKHPSNFSLAVYLKECLKPEILQQAVNDVVKRLPFLNIRLKRGFLWYHHKIRTQPLLIQKEKEKNSSNLLKVFYGEQHFILEVMHSVCDGRGLSKIVSTLVVRYFELQGITVDKTEMIDCDGDFNPQEMEDAFVRYGNAKTRTLKNGQGRGLFVEKAYKSKNAPLKTMQIKTYRFELDKLKSTAKQYGATINEYILACIFKAISNERNSRNCKKPIKAFIPFDCRCFFPSETLRNFATSVSITMPETTDMANMIKQIREQSKLIDKDFVLADITIMQKICKNLRFIPRIIKKHLFRIGEKLNVRGLSFVFSNVGLVKLPKEIEQRIDMMELVMKCNPRTPYSFTCVSIGNTLSLAIKMLVDADNILGESKCIIL